MVKCKLIFLLFIFQKMKAIPAGRTRQAGASRQPGNSLQAGHRQSNLSTRSILTRTTRTSKKTVFLQNQKSFKRWILGSKIDSTYT